MLVTSEETQTIFIKEIDMKLFIAIFNLAILMGPISYGNNSSTTSDNNTFILLEDGYVYEDGDIYKLCENESDCLDKHRFYINGYCKFDYCESDAKCEANKYYARGHYFCIYPKKVFAAGNKYSWGSNGDFNSLKTADAICQDLAKANNLPSSYLAWLSDSQDSPSTRFNMSMAPYVRVDGVIIGDTFSMLKNNMKAPINVTESGITVPENDDNALRSTIFTGVSHQHLPIVSYEYCQNWSSNNPNQDQISYGDANATTSA